MSKNISGNAQVFGDARVYGDAQVSDNALVSGNAKVYDNARVSGNAQVWGNAQVSGDAWVSGDADISCNRDWFLFTYEGQTLTGYRSRNADGYELNIDGECESITLHNIQKSGVLGAIKELIAGFTPFPTKVAVKSDVDVRIDNLERELNELKAARKKEVI